MKELKELKNLRTLILDSTKVTPAGIKELYAALPELTIYNGPPVPRASAAEDKAAQDKAVADKKQADATAPAKAEAEARRAGIQVLDGGQETLTLKGHTSIVTSVMFSADGKRLASASADGTVKVWDVTPRTGGKR